MALRILRFGPSLFRLSFGVNRIVPFGEMAWWLGPCW